MQLTDVRPKVQSPHSAARLRSWLWPLVIVLSSIGISVVVWGDVHSPVRPLLAFWFLCLCPGMAFVRLLDLEDGYIQLTLAIALSLVLDTAVATALLYAHRWSAAHAVGLLAGLSLVGVALDVMVAHRRRRTVGRSTVPFVALRDVARVAARFTYVARVAARFTYMAREATRFTYMPREAAPALRRWGRRVALVLLSFLLAYVGAQRLATALRHAQARPSAPRTGVTRHQGPTNRVHGRSIQPPVALRNPAMLSPIALLNPTMLSWGDQSVHTASAPLLIHVVNVGPTPLTMTHVLIGGINPRDFNARGTCAPRTLGSYDGCTVAVRFTPLASGTRRATLIIRDNAVASPQQVPLTGHGRAG